MDYKAYALMAILLASVASVALAGTAYAQTTQLTVELDAESYETGDTVTVSGQLTATNINQPLVIQVLDPQGNRDRLDQFEAAADGSYSYEFAAGGLMNTDGEYTVRVSYRTTSEEATFDYTFTGESGWRTYSLNIEGNAYPIRYQITGGSLVSMEADVATSTLTATISSTAEGQLILELPRSTMDARAGADGQSGADEAYVVFTDGVEGISSEETTSSVRTLTIDFEQGTDTIEIVGTFIVPEFGAIAAIVLAVAIVGIIVATARYGKFNFAPRL